MIHNETTEFGFIFGAATVTRVCANEKNGTVTMMVKTPKCRMVITVTKGGAIREAKFKARTPATAQGNEQNAESQAERWPIEWGRLNNLSPMALPDSDQTQTIGQPTAGAAVDFCEIEP